MMINSVNKKAQEQNMDRKISMRFDSVESSQNDDDEDDSEFNENISSDEESKQSKKQSDDYKRSSSLISNPMANDEDALFDVDSSSCGSSSVDGESEYSCSNSVPKSLGKASFKSKASKAKSKK